MLTLDKLNRYLALQAHADKRGKWSKRSWRTSPVDPSTHGLTHADVEVDGHVVAVTEDEVGVVELYEE